MRKDYLFYVYIMSNYERNVLYIGVTNDLIRRVIEHQYEIGSEFTRRYKTKYLMYYEEYQYVNDAINREKEIKKWRREKKMNLIKTQNPGFEDLGGQLFEESGLVETEIKEYLGEIINSRKS